MDFLSVVPHCRVIWSEHHLSLSLSLSLSLPLRDLCFWMLSFEFECLRMIISLSLSLLLPFRFQYVFYLSLSPPFLFLKFSYYAKSNYSTIVVYCISRCLTGLFMFKRLLVFDDLKLIQIARLVCMRAFICFRHVCGVWKCELLFMYLKVP